jgi:hypothetical protein
MKSGLRESELMQALEGRLHLLDEAIEMDIRAMLWEFIGSEKYQIEEAPDTRESHIECAMCKS